MDVAPRIQTTATPSINPHYQHTVLVCHSHKDTKARGALLAHLSRLQRPDFFDLWSDDDLGVGKNWLDAFNGAVARANVAVLLVSANFLGSIFMVRQQVLTLLARHQRQGLVIYPVITGACAWRKVGWLTRLKVRPKHGAPVWSNGGRHVDEDLAAIAREVIGAFEIARCAAHAEFGVTANIPQI